MPSDPSMGPDLFRCVQCGDCCKGYGGTYLTPDDVAVIADYLQVDRRRFEEKFCRLSGGRPLLAQGANGYCIFWDRVCTIHPVKPRMCKAWPFIPGILADVSNWHSMATTCPGMRVDVSETSVLAAVRAAMQSGRSSG